MPHPEETILTSWHINAAAWTDAIQQEIIESRKLVTNDAIVQAVKNRQPKQVLDLGCGEGWLCRRLESLNINTSGYDAIPGLIDKARQAGKGNFEIASYQQIVSGNKNPGSLFDVVVFNFSLFGEDLVTQLLQKVKTWLAPQGCIIIQTLHPYTAKGDGAYQTGWRAGSWEGFPDSFTMPAPWYYRTLQSWLETFTTAGLNLKYLQEPIHPHTKLPASIIFELEMDHQPIELQPFYRHTL